MVTDMATVMVMRNQKNNEEHLSTDFMISFFTGKKNILHTGLLEKMGDIHCHLLPGVDDGVKTEDEAIDSFIALREMGVRSFILTPHVMEEISNNTRTVLEGHFNCFLSKVPEGVEVRLAAEYMLDANFLTHMKDGLLSMGDNFVLVETSYLSPPPEMQDMIYEILLNGYQPILAHPERYVYMTDKDYVRWKQAGCKFQLNLLSLSGYYGRSALLSARKLIKKGFYDFVGSDFHNLKKYKEGLKHLYLSSSERKEIEKLLVNNQNLMGDS